MLYFAIITVLLVIFYLLPSEAKAGTSDNEVDYSNVEVIQDTGRYEKVCDIETSFKFVFKAIKFQLSFCSVGN